MVALGIITKVALQLVPKPNSTAVCLVSIASFKRISDLLCKIRLGISEVVSAIEYMDAASLLAVKQSAPATFNK